MNEYRVGQILFLIADASKVVPIQVIEEVIRTTLEGKEKTYIIKLPDKKGTTVDIKKVKGRLFTSKSEVSSFMIENAKNAIEQMITEAETISISVFESHPNDVILDEADPQVYTLHMQRNDLPAEENNEKVQQEDEDDIIKVDLGNGKFGKIKTGDFNKAGALDWKYFY